MNIDNTKRKIAYTLAEFAALFGMERTWAYRLLYAGKIMAITGYGNTMVPDSEVEKLLNDKQRYTRRRRGKSNEGNPKDGGQS